MIQGNKRNFKPLEILTESNLDAIEDGVFYLLENVGLKFEVETQRIFKIFEDAGCVINSDDKTVKFPPSLVRECLKKCPSEFRLEARDSSNNLLISDKTVHYRPGPGMKYLDIDSWEPRDPTREEFYDAVRIYDSLPNLHLWHGNTPYTNIEGVHPLLSTIETYASRARFSTKVNFHGASDENDRFCLEISKIIGAKGFFGVGAISPLGWSNVAINALVRAVEAGVPVAVMGGAVWGAPAPATIAGEVVTNIAETMGPLILTQLISPNHPYMPGSFTFPMNMQTGDPFFGNITTSLATTALTQYWRRHNIPAMLIEASIPNSKCMDFQTGYEKGMNAFIQALSGAAIIHIHGTIYGQLIAHPVQAIMDDDVAGMIGRFLEGITVNDETLAIDLIEAVGPIPGFYLDQAHTRKWWKQEQFIPAVAELSNLQDWLRSGKRTTIDLAKEKMGEILASHEVSKHLSQSQIDDIEKVILDAKSYYKNRLEA